MNYININPDCCWEGIKDVERYFSVQKHRKQKYGQIKSDKYFKVVEQVNENGYAKIENFIDPKRLDVIKKGFEKIKRNKQLQYDDFYTEQVGHPLLTCDGVFDIAFDDELIKISNLFYDCLPAITAYFIASAMS